MKRFLALILSVVYITLSSGANVNIHFCCGELESIHINSKVQTCCCGTIEMSQDCCTDEYLDLELNTDQTYIYVQNIVPEQIAGHSILYNTINTLIDEPSVNDQVFYSNLLPKTQDVWLINCTFIFYG